MSSTKSTPAVPSPPLKNSAYYNKNKAYFQAYYQQHRETLLEYARVNHKRTYAAQKDKKIQRAKAHHAQHREKKLAQMKAYYLKTKAKRAASTQSQCTSQSYCRQCESQQRAVEDNDDATAAAQLILHMTQASTSSMMSMQYLLNPIDDCTPRDYSPQDVHDELSVDL
ncbi:hypothetical protein DYB37_008651 [Aphanomyces astaci]|uniref:Uncharacterized protein n=1 Tax=Aphanomyces astaci TaxID=112090 RepID=A0A397F3D8_APHAT|nr:hypothetical protein DYB25_004801 [Aphanomyces astaci]RHX99078.1 hypothetical protein DYB36_004842 [Aphanomyces astaci]RHY45698.1 hypothetical protein DYB38_012078 [Aphanomyces astaci]RHY46696.1 hypothetical protein DYB30_008047 [Aphanomyces astaci]RHY92937.1 hypothetical protein DYB35_012917 [Aphanomyces astaci]